ncbi:MAG TPA: exodeoxyribonuclease V subunit beta [Dokdonella sp.]
MSAELTRTLPLSGIRLIEASAGTGKTWTIAGLYLRLVVERRLAVRDVLVVTFTRAATDELKDRLRERLNGAADLAERRVAGVAAGAVDAGAEAQFASALIDAAIGAGESALDLARRLRLAAIGTDEAAIHTIHAFCQRALREQAFAAGEPLEPGELIGSDADLLAQIAADFWRRCATDPARRAEFALLAARAGSAARLAGVLLAIVDPDLVVEPTPSGDAEHARARLDAAERALDAATAALLDAWRRYGERDGAALLAHAEHLNQTTHPRHRLERWLADCRDCGTVGAAPPRTTLERLGAQVLAARVKKGRPPLPPLAFAAAADAWLAADDALAAARAECWPALLASARAYAIGELERRKQRAARQSYDDLVRRLHRAVVDPARGDALAAALAARWPAALVDEFQDTDARQFEIFRRVYARPGAALILVGDPKQAIYRFRGGDIHAYLQAAAGAQSVERLERNFRSSPAYLRALEAVYAVADPDRAFVDPRIRFHAVAPGGRAADDDVLVDGAPVVPLTVWQLPPAALGANKDDGAERLALGCAEAIVQLLGRARAGAASVLERGTRRRVALAPRHLAVLVATNAEADRMQRALAARGVAAATIRQASVFATDEAADLLVLLAALESRDETQLRAALATRLLGFDAAAIAALLDPAAPQRWLAELARLDELDRVWRRHGVLAMCERVFERRAADLLAGADGERRVTNYLQLAERLQEASAHAFGASGLIDWLRRRIALADKNDEDEQLRLESDGERVRIATIHASKGLEYDLVFLPFTALRPGVGSASPACLLWHDGDRRRVRVRTSGERDDEAVRAAAAAAEREDLAERMRVLYVALTRARYACWLSWDAIGSGGAVPALAQLWHGGVAPADAAAAHAAVARLVAAAPDVVRARTLPEPGGDRLDALAPVELPPARAFSGRIDASWWIYSFSQLRDGERAGLGDTAGADDESPALDADVADAGADVVAEVPDWPRSAAFGVALHEVLERVDFAAWRGHGAAAPPPAERARIAHVLQRHALAPGREAELQRVVAQLVAATLNARLPGDVALAELAPAARRAEMPFHFAIGGVEPERLIALLREHGYQRRRAGFARVQTRIAGLMTGIVDLVYRHAGRWWLADYKTNWLGPRRTDYAPAALAAAVREHDYDLQYLIYTVALHRWLRARLGAAYDYTRDFGGATYLFVRGLGGGGGVHFDRPPLALIDALDAAFAPGAPR